MNQLIRLVEKLKNQKIMVVGDLGIDEYVAGAVQRISPEAPVPVVEVQRENCCVGLSGNVAQNISSLGGQPILISVIGNDKAGEDLQQLLSQEGVAVGSLVVDSSRPTTRKLRVMSGQHHIVRVDFEERRFLSSEIEEAVLQKIEEQIESVDAVVLQDYAKGVISESLAQKLMAVAHSKGVPVLVDPTRTAPLKIYRGATVFKPNYDEAIALSGLPADDLHQSEDFVQELATVMKEVTAAKHVIITQGKEGMSIFSGEKRLQVPTMAKQVYDVTGAGDTVIATLALAFSAGLSVEESCRLANAAAGVVVGKVGSVPCSYDQLKEALSEG